MQRFCLHPASWGRTFDGPCAALRLDEELSNPNDLRGVKEKHIFIKEWIQGPVKEFVLRAACVEGNILINVSLLGRCVNICRDWADSALNIALGRIRRPPGSRGGGSHQVLARVARGAQGCPNRPAEVPVGGDVVVVPQLHAQHSLALAVVEVELLRVFPSDSPWIVPP